MVGPAVAQVLFVRVAYSWASRVGRNLRSFGRGYFGPSMMAGEVLAVSRQPILSSSAAVFQVVDEGCIGRTLSLDGSGFAATGQGVG